MSKIEVATLGAGCFWCVEAIYKRLNGVVNVKSGYAGGHVISPTYEEVCEGETGHAEVCKIEYDSSVISFDELLSVFFEIHDPTSLNRQGNDVGTQYRSVIFYQNESQKNRAEGVISILESESRYKNKIVTEISKYTNFFEAENYHKSYYDFHKEEPYCRLIILPKLESFKTKFSAILKE